MTEYEQFTPCDDDQPHAAHEWVAQYGMIAVSYDCLGVPEPTEPT